MLLRLKEPSIIYTTGYVNVKQVVQLRVGIMECGIGKPEHILAVQFLVGELAD